MHHSAYKLIIVVKNKKLLLHSITVTAESSKNDSRQVNDKFLLIHNTNPYYDFIANYVLCRARIMNSEMPSFHIWSHLHQVPSASCGIRYIVYPGLASCPFYEIPKPLRLITPEPEGNYQLQTSDDYKVKSCI